MKLGYSCINRSIGCSANKTFRLQSYSEGRLQEIIKNNLACLKKILEYNAQEGFLFFRISSGTIPFASHPINNYQWEEKFKVELEEIGAYIKKHNMRISMHPDQFVLLNSPRKEVTQASIAELRYHARLLDSMKLDETAKIQIHIGGVYGNKQEAIQRFIDVYKKLPQNIRKRLVIENDDVSYNLQDCLEIHKQTSIPIIFDFFHHEILNNKETFKEAITKIKGTWKEKDGIPMTDYSSQWEGERKGKHTYEIQAKHFIATMKTVADEDFDIMLEIKNKEISAQIAKKSLEKLGIKHFLKH